jgi:hypothetical protein
MKAMQSLDKVQLGWLFEKSSFVVAADGTKCWLEALMGQELAQTLDFQVQSKGIKFSQFVIETKTYVYVISASRATLQDTYDEVLT